MFFGEMSPFIKSFVIFIAIKITAMILEIFKIHQQDVSKWKFLQKIIKMSHKKTNCNISQGLFRRFLYFCRQ